MAALVTSAQVEKVIRKALTSEGYNVSIERGHGETGADTIAEKENEKICVEAIAFKSSPPARAKDFYEAVFRAISRVEDKADLCVIALPARFGMGLTQRARAIGAAWIRLSKAFPELKIWLVDTTLNTIKRSDWNEWSS